MLSYLQPSKDPVYSSQLSGWACRWGGIFHINFALAWDWPQGLDVAVHCTTEVTNRHHLALGLGFQGPRFAGSALCRVNSFTTSTARSDQNLSVLRRSSNNHKQVVKIHANPLPSHNISQEKCHVTTRMPNIPSQKLPHRAWEVIQSKIANPITVHKHHHEGADFDCTGLHTEPSCIWPQQTSNKQTGDG